MKLRDPYGFVYITTNLVNGKRYIGQKTFDGRSRWKSYLGSGIHLQASISKYGRENFKRVIVAFGETAEVLNLMEYNYIKALNAVRSPHFYNQVDGGHALTMYNKQNSVGCIDIVTGQIFESITDACGYAQCSDTLIKSSFHRKHDYTFMTDTPIFRRLDEVKNIEQMCCICGEDEDTLVPYNDKKVRRCMECDKRIKRQIKESKKNAYDVRQLETLEAELCETKRKRRDMERYGYDCKKAYHLGVSTVKIPNFIDAPISASTVSYILYHYGLRKRTHGRRYYTVHKDNIIVGTFHDTQRMLSWFYVNKPIELTSSKDIKVAIDRSILDDRSLGDYRFSLVDTQTYLGLK